jgi:hypothetical protein
LSGSLRRSLHWRLELRVTDLDDPSELLFSEELAKVRLTQMHVAVRNGDPKLEAGHANPSRVSTTEMQETARVDFTPTNVPRRRRPIVPEDD